MRSLLIILAMLLSSTALAFGPQSSNKNVLWGFDFVEEFDGLADWQRPRTTEYNVFNTTSGGMSRMPKLASGADSAWGYYSNWQGAGVNEPSPAPWVGSETESGRQIWRGTKSAAIDLGNTAYGPSRLGLWFGSGRYSSFNLFHMVYIPRNMFPTECYWISDNTLAGNCGNGTRGEYTEGQPYHYYPAWKFGTFNMDCQAADCRVGTGTESYGAQYFIPVFRPSGTVGGSGSINLFVEKSGQQFQAVDSNTPVSAMFGDWYGWEVQVRTNSPNTFLVDVWIYDRNGTDTHIMNSQQITLQAGHEGKLWDQFFFGGNNSNGWLWGSSMQSHYYVDDFIVDDHSKGRIGPRYFAAIAQDNVPVSKPNAATNFSYTTRSRDAVVAGGATRGNLTQCPDGKWATVCKATVYDVRINCTNPTTRKNGNSFLPAGILSLDWIFEPTGDGKTHSVKVPRCPFLVDLPPATYTVKQRTVLTHSGDGKIGDWSQISNSMEVPAP